MPTIYLTTSSYIQAQHLCFIARSIQLGKYSSQTYTVIPHLLPEKVHTVIFPDADYPSEFWKSLSTVSNYAVGQIHPSFATNYAYQIAQQIPKAKLPAPWQDKCTDFLKQIVRTTHPDYCNNIISIIILPTLIGSPGTFSITSQGTSKTLLCTVRMDLPIQNCFETILKGIISTHQSADADLGTRAYIEREAIFNFLKHHTSLRNMLQWEPDTTLSPHMRLQGSNYLKKIGFPETKSWDVDAFTLTLTRIEKRAFTCLWKNAGTLVSFDDMADALWKEQADEKFSLYALAKIIQNLRTKLKKFGIQKETITTIRKQGYLFTP